ncbi:Gfo/Idh/MocA family protein [Plantactinospora endophytica]|uniref:Glucose-fructose oxidoreductase n=1 Tax=Plantactinospora endophytica TaxID=673535 RepID=A0ABQ4E542_9ACTN|nr:Gfo/Idh/MocA family oxidoreductase [Plantactinospora endophytica]GIG89820.1 glucose-fructose oxidoreductase [Plantactinospora endophytica]
MTFRIGIVGAGFLARRSLLPAIAAADDLRLVAVLDPDEAALRAVAAEAPGIWCGTDARDFLRTPLDGVHVATPNRRHAEYACRALARGIPTLVEKPLADTVAGGQWILRAAMASGAPAMVGYMSRYNAYNRAVVELVRSGQLGAARSISACHLGHRQGDWRNRRADSGLGCLGDLAIYPLLTAVDVFDAAPTACRATGYPAGDRERTEIFVEATVWFGEERRLQVESSFTEPPDVGVSRYTVVCERGLLVVRDSWAMDSGGSVLVCDERGRRWLRPEPVDPYLAQYRVFAASAAGEPVPVEVGVARGLRDLRVLHALERSVANGGMRLALTGGQNP